jgi:ubiquinone/menaquinone biosynthesis C-methylase UbiE
MDFVARERERIRREYERRAREIDSDRYASWQPAERFATEKRNRKAAVLLRCAGISLAEGTQCLEVGCGAGGWFSQLIEWGVAEDCLHGIELDPQRADQARARFASADIRTGDAVELPWPTGTFQIVIASTVFTSVLATEVRQLIANEIQRVIAPGGALLWYDFAFNNPRNPNVRGIKRRELTHLFPELNGEIKSVTLAPPLARLLAPKSLRVAELLEAVPVLRTHLLGVLVKDQQQSEFKNV